MQSIITTGNISFSDPLIAPIRQEIKQETRRSIRWPPNAPDRPTGYNFCVVEPVNKGLGDWEITWPGFSAEEFKQPDGNILSRAWPSSPIKCPYKVGGIYWLRESYYAYGYWRDVEGKLTPGGKQKREFVDLTVINTLGYRYADTAPTAAITGPGMGWYKRLARFMPRTAARLFVQVTDVLAQNLEELTDADALAEGIVADEHGVYPIPGSPAQFRPSFPRLAFKRLWENLHGDYDPLHHVWVVKFKLLK